MAFRLPHKLLELMLTSLTLKGAVTLLILAAAIYSFISEALPPDVTALLAIVALLLTGALTPAEAFAGFSRTATISVAAVLALPAGIKRTGVLFFLARRLLALIGHSELLLTIVIIFVIGVLSCLYQPISAIPLPSVSAK